MAVLYCYNRPGGEARYKLIHSCSSESVYTLRKEMSAHRRSRPCLGLSLFRSTCLQISVRNTEHESTIWRPKMHLSLLAPLKMSLTVCSRLNRQRSNARYIAPTL